MMISVRAALVAVWFCFVVAAVHAEPAKGSTEGVFAGLEQGDYTHLLLRAKGGGDVSFIVLQPDKSVQPFLDKPEKLKGRAVRVFWKMATIPESGGREKTVVKIE